MILGTASEREMPIYNLFVQQAKKLEPRYLTMIVPVSLVLRVEKVWMTSVKRC